jgi:hypothetical protein
LAAGGFKIDKSGDGEHVSFEMPFDSAWTDFIMPPVTFGRPAALIYNSFRISGGLIFSDYLCFPEF